jgi:ATP/maltotriose-dependent transcriptional regulator MalT
VVAAIGAPRLVGRDAELARISGVLDAVAEGAQALVLHGEPGIGKTALWASAVAQARSRGAVVLSARPAEAESALPFVVLGDLLGAVSDAQLAQLPFPQRHALEAALLRREPEEDVERLALSVGVLAVVRSLARDAPLVVAVDDLQWTDAPSRAILAFALRRLVEEPVTLIATTRRDDDELFGELSTNRIVRIQVAPLDDAAVAALVRAQAPSRRERAAVLAVLERAGGNPFFALELARAQEQAGAMNLPLPASLEGLVSQRLERVPASAREVLLAASILRRPSRPVLEAIAKAGTRAVDEAVASGVLQEDGDSLRFAHPLLASAVRGSASPHDRRKVHRRAADAVTEPEERALHRALATTAPDEAVAAEAEAAASRATARGAPEAGSILAGHAARLTPADAHDDARRRALAEAEYASVAGDLAGARAVLERVLDELEPGPERVRVLFNLARTQEGKEWKRTLQQALDESADLPAEQARIRNELSRTSMLELDWARAAEHAAAAIELAERARSRREQVSALVRLAHVELWSGRGDPVATLERALALESELDTPMRMLESPVRLLGVALTHHDQLARARSFLLEAYERARTSGALDRVAPLMNLAELECRAGDWQRALDYALEGEALAREWGNEDLEGVILSALAWVRAHLGEVDATRADAERGCALANQQNNMFYVLRNERALGFLELSLGNYAAAHARLGPIVERLDAMVGEPSVIAVVPNEIEALLGLGELDQAVTLLTRLEARARSLDRPWALASAARCRALLEAARGDVHAAEAALAWGFAAHERLGEPFELGRILLAQGTILRRAKRKAEARRSLERACEMFDPLGARIWAEKARTELARTGTRHVERGELTPTEGEVARLAAAGSKNREIAQTLFMSEKTVEWNLSKIYGKLDVRSKAELARKLSAETAAADAKR